MEWHERMNKAELAGYVARRRGIERAPIKDEALQIAFVNTLNSNMQRVAVLEAWLQGWDNAQADLMHELAPRSIQSESK